MKMIAWCALFLALGLTASGTPLAPKAAYSEFVRSPRIVGGWEALEGMFPYQLNLRLVNTAGLMHACGAALIHVEWGLTAAHCTALRVRVIVSAGSNSFSQPLVQFDAVDYFTHPSFDDNAFDRVQPNDISLVKFGRSTPLTTRIEPIRLALSEDKNNDFAGVRLVASGWGSTTTGGPLPDLLRWVNLQGVSNLECAEAYGFNPIIQESTICTVGYTQISQSTCHGDNGSPLVTVDEDTKSTLIGISSFMPDLGCNLGIPAGFVRVSHYHDWFTEITGINFDGEKSPEEEDSSEEDSSQEDSSEEKEDSSESDEDSSEESPEEVTEGPEEEVTETVTEAPEEEVTEAPEEEVTEAPEEEVTEAPEEEVTEGPEEEVTEAPEEEVTEAPEEEVTEAPEEEVTEAPEEEVTEGPEEEVTEAPEEEVTTSPEEEVTEAPEGEVTEAPEEEVTEAPEEEVTEAPEEEVTEAPEEEVTEAPEEDGEESNKFFDKMMRFFRNRA